MFRMFIALITTSLALAQGPATPAPEDRIKLQIRYGVEFTEDNQQSYSQKTPKETLTSAVKILEAKRYELFVAHFLAPEFVDKKVNDRVRLIEPTIEKQMLSRRDWQKQNPKLVNNADRLPDDPVPFANAIRAEATKLAFGQVVEEIKKHMDESPEVIRHFQKYIRVDEFSITGTLAQTSHKDIPDKILYFSLINGRWFLENRQAEEVKPVAPIPMTTTPMPKQ